MIKSKPCTVEGCTYPRWAKGFCKAHGYLRTDKKKPSSLSSTSKKKVTGEAVVFDMIREERENISFISGIGVPCIAHNFSHCLSKAENRYPKFKLYKKNIVLLSEQEHKLYDEGTEEQREEYAVFMKKKYNVFVDWNKLYILAAELKEEYSQLKD